MQASCKPILVYEPKGVLTGTGIGSRRLREQPQGLFQSVLHLADSYGCSLNPHAMRLDPFYALSEIFCFVATAERQFLNFMDTLVNEEIYSTKTTRDFAISNLKHSRQVIDCHSRSLEEVLRFLRSREDICPSPESHTCSVANALIIKKFKSMLEDYEWLFHQASSISSHCVEGISIITNDAMLEEARKTMVHGKEVKILTLLAFFYLPLTLISSIFGMNVVQLGQGHISIGWALLAILAALLFQCVIYFFHGSIRGALHVIQDTLKDWMR
ncbi:hypothetical protein F5Y19DRAFT_421693 [Xylariaceae sp. FL1651]|nr:hypothetical protein F5Y19DRAFT_421693 [Xylariaceae sp. FL1651]